MPLLPRRAVVAAVSLLWLGEAAIRASSFLAVREASANRSGYPIGGGGRSRIVGPLSSDGGGGGGNDNIRLNKAFKETHSRRKADELIAAGRVEVNGEVVADMGRRVVPFVDEIRLDGTPYLGWEAQHGFSSSSSSSSSLHSDGAFDRAADEEYIKYWKPQGVTSTTDRDVRENILDAVLGSRSAAGQPPIRRRIFTVGRLDKDSTGIILLTSDGRVPNAVLRSKFGKIKTYRVRVDWPLRASDIKGLRNGVTITTDRVRGGRHEPFTAKTLPCKVSAEPGDVDLTIRLAEGRNRQIRAMLASLGYGVVSLHRDDFMGIGLDGLDRPGDWKRLTSGEVSILGGAIAMAEESERRR